MDLQVPSDPIFVSCAAPPSSSGRFWWASCCIGAAPLLSHCLPQGPQGKALAFHLLSAAVATVQKHVRFKQRRKKNKQQRSGEHSSEGKLDCRVCLGFSFGKGRCNMENSPPSFPRRQWARPSFCSLSRKQKG